MEMAQVFLYVKNFLRILLVIFCSKGTFEGELLLRKFGVFSNEDRKIPAREWMMSQLLLVTISEIGYIV